MNNYQTYIMCKNQFIVIKISSINFLLRANIYKGMDFSIYEFVHIKAVNELRILEVPTSKDFFPTFIFHDNNGIEQYFDNFELFLAFLGLEVQTSNGSSNFQWKFKLPMEVSNVRQLVRFLRSRRITLQNITFHENLCAMGKIHMKVLVLLIEISSYGRNFITQEFNQKNQYFHTDFLHGTKVFMKSDVFYKVIRLDLRNRTSYRTFEASY